MVFIDGQAYDVARYAARHPGGAILLRFLGRDASAVFAAFHGPTARATLRALRWRGPALEAPPAESARDAEADFEALRLRAEAEGLFEARPLWFYGHALFIVGLVVASACALVATPHAWPLAALALALAWQQAGWLAHDFLHQGVHREKRHNDLVGLAIGGVLLGFSADWWKKKHNTHHALPNVLGVDEDIDTLPLLAFDERDLERAGAFSRAMVGLQPLTVIPVLAFARLNWCVQSLWWSLRAPGVPRRGLELAAIAAHHAWVIGLLALLPDWTSRIALYAVAQLVSGLLVGSVFIVGHNARPLLSRDESPGFYELQCLTTQDVAAMSGSRWFFGGLDHQIEHHLFPTLPRHHHARLAPAVRELCARHGIPYTRKGFFAGLVDVMGVLSRVARAARSASSARVPA